MIAVRLNPKPAFGGRPGKLADRIENESVRPRVERFIAPSLFSVNRRDFDDTGGKSPSQRECGICVPASASCPGAIRPESVRSFCVEPIEAGKEKVIAFPAGLTALQRPDWSH
jgi:hypothetical protein